MLKIKLSIYWISASTVFWGVYQKKDLYTTLLEDSVFNIPLDSITPKYKIKWRETLEKSLSNVKFKAASYEAKIFPHFVQFQIAAHWVAILADIYKIPNKCRVKFIWPIFKNNCSISTYVRCHYGKMSVPRGTGCGYISIKYLWKFPIHRIPAEAPLSLEYLLSAE